MVSGNSGSTQSSSGDEEDYDSISRLESVQYFWNPSSQSFLNTSSQFNPISNQHPSFLGHNQLTFFDHSSALSQSQQGSSIPNSLLNHDPTDLGNLQGLSSSGQAILASQGLGQNPLSCMQLRPVHDNVARSSPQSDQTNVVKKSKKRTRASRRARTTLIATDTSNFSQMVQEFTGMPAPPFSGSSYNRGLDLFGSGSALPSGHLEPRGPLYSLHPSAQKGNEKVCPKQVDTKEALDRHSPSKYNRFEEEIEISAVENPNESQKEALVTAAKNVPSQLMAGISKHDKAPSTPQCALSAMGEACSRGDITAIHQILVRTPYRDAGVSEMSDKLETMLRHGDHAFCKQDFKTAIDYYSQFIDAMVSPVIFARRSLCYLFCDQLDDALHDAKQAQCVYPKWPTAFYLQSVAFAKLGMHKVAAGLLNEAARLEEKSQQETDETRTGFMPQIQSEKGKISAVDGRIKPEMMQTQEAEGDALLVQSAGDPTSLMSAVEDAEMIPEASGQQGSKATLQSIESEIVQIEEMHAQSHPSSALRQNDMSIEISLDTATQNGVVNSVTQPGEGKLFLMLGLTEPPKEEEWKNAKEIHLMHNKLSKLPENPRCPMLSALFLQRNSKLRLIPHSFFDDMPALQVLNLSNTAIRSLPESLFRLVSLKRLFLNDCRNFMMLSPKVGELKQLEVLDLEGTEIMDLPKEMKNLTGLKCLEVSLFGYADDGRRVKKSNAMVPSGIISALSEVEELNIDVNPDDERWDACAEAIVNEVCSLMKLSTLKFYFPRVEFLSHFQWNSTSMVYPRLSNFRFIVGDHVGRIMTRLPRDVEFELERWDRCLKYVNGVGVPGEIKKVLRHATAFHLDRHTTVEKLTEFGIENMEHLKCCVVGECNKLQVIIDAADFLEEDDSGEIVPKLYGDRRTGLESLEFLYIHYMKNLRSIWEGPLQKKCLILLKSLTLHTCPQLTTIFTRELLDNLCNLEELTVENCPAITSIVSCETFAEHNTAYFLPKLRKISLHFLPELTSISNGLHIAPKLEWMSFYYCPNLKSFAIEEVSSKDLKKIKVESRWWEALEWRSGRPDYFDDIFVLVDICD